MYAQFYNPKVLPSQTKKHKNMKTMCFIKPKLNIIKPILENFDSDEEWDREAFSYHSILKKRIMSILLNTTNINKDIIGVIFDYLYIVS